MKEVEWEREGIRDGMNSWLKRKNSFVCKQARIKKIMQADEEVGKIAMATPVLICMLLPPSTHDLLPFHHHLSIVCADLHTTALCVCVCVSVSYTHIQLSY